MTLSLYIQCGAMFILGQLLHLYWIKFPSFKKRASDINKPFSYTEWWNCDKFVVIGLQLAGITLFVGLDQFLHFKPEVIDYTKWLFWALGAFGSNVVMQRFSQYGKTQSDLANIKSNISDSLTGVTRTVQEAIEKGSEVTHSDVTKSPNQ